MHPGPWRPKLVPTRCFWLDTVPRPHKVFSLPSKNPEPLGPAHMTCRKHAFNPKEQATSARVFPCFSELSFHVAAPSFSRLISKQHQGCPLPPPFSGDMAVLTDFLRPQTRGARWAEGWRPSGFQQEASRVAEKLRSRKERGH